MTLRWNWPLMTEWWNENAASARRVSVEFRRETIVIVNLNTRRLHLHDSVKRSVWPWDASVSYITVRYDWHEICCGGRCMSFYWRGALACSSRLRRRLVPPTIFTGAVLAQKFWGGGIAPSAPSSPCPFSPFFETEKNTNFMWAYIWNLLVGCQLCNGLDPETRRNEARRAKVGDVVLGKASGGAL